MRPLRSRNDFTPKFSGRVTPLLLLLQRRLRDVQQWNRGSILGRVKRPAVEPSQQPSIRWPHETFGWGGKRPAEKSDLSPPSARIRMAAATPLLPP